MGVERRRGDAVPPLDEGRHLVAEPLVGEPGDRDLGDSGCSDSTLSISPGETFSPPVMIRSSTRPVTKRSPRRRNSRCHGEIPAAVKRPRVGIGAAP